MPKTMTQRLREHFIGLPQEEQVELIKKTAQQLHKSFKLKQRALEAERNAPARTNTHRGGKRTTLQAATENAATTYESTKEMLKLYMSLI